jgi:hypothetical protein
MDPYSNLAREGPATPLHFFDFSITWSSKTAVSIQNAVRQERLYLSFDGHKGPMLRRKNGGSGDFYTQPKHPKQFFAVSRIISIYLKRIYHSNFNQKRAK